MPKLSERLVLARSRASDLETVRKLNCWGSDLTDVTILRKMPNVQVISLSVNHITTLADFAHCHNLEELYIRKNDICNLAEICHLQKLSKLRILWLADNPCAVGDRYRLTVLKTLPNLQKLDNVVVQEEEVNDALDQGMEITLSQESSTAIVDPPPPVQNGPVPDMAGDRMNGDTDKVAEEVKLENGGDKSETESTEKQQNGPHAKQEEPDVSDSEKTEQIVDPSGHTETEKEENQSSSNSATAEDLQPNSERPETITIEETNKIREQLGLKPLCVDRLYTAKPRITSGAKHRNANIVQAILCLIKDLDAESLETVGNAVSERLEAM